MLAWSTTNTWMILVSILSSVERKDVELKSQYFFLMAAWLKLRPTRGGWSGSPAPLVLGAWPVKQQPQKTFVLSSVCSVRVVILWIQYVGPVTSVSTAVHSVVLLGVLRYSVVQLSVLGFSSSTFTHVACWCFCQYSAWSPGDVTVCRKAKGLFAAVEGRFH